jgi:hypothetical protein
VVGEFALLVFELRMVKDIIGRFFLSRTLLKQNQSQNYCLKKNSLSLNFK